MCVNFPILINPFGHSKKVNASILTLSFKDILLAPTMIAFLEIKTFLPNFLKAKSFKSRFDRKSAL